MSRTIRKPVKACDQFAVTVFRSGKGGPCRFVILPVLGLALLLSMPGCRISAPEDSGGEKNSAGSARELELRLMNKSGAAAENGRKTAASLRIGSMFRDHMVLQRNVPIRITGSAARGSRVELEFAGQKLTTRCGESGRWVFELKPMPASDRPLKLQISSGGERITIGDVLVGDVWLVSGQSNMVCSADMKISEYKARAGFYKEKASALRAKMAKIAEWNEPEIRFYTVGSGQWKKCVHRDAMDCSLAAMFFARKLNRTLKIPVGLINTSFGCASIEAFLPLESLEQGGFPALAAEGRAYQKLLEQGGPAKLDRAGRNRLLLEHCRNPRYFFCKPYADRAGKGDPKKYRLIEWHMSVVKPGAVFLATVVKVLDFPIRGMLWYQGETNIYDNNYAAKQKLLAEAMRRLTKNPGLPFYAVMVAPSFTTTGLWAQQYAAAAGTPGTALVNTVDTPPDEQSDYHPSTKDFIGERLALAALNRAYGMKKIAYSGPVFEGIRHSGRSLLVSFRHAAGLQTKDGKVPLGFEIAGADRRFVPADARIEGGVIRVSAPATANPQYVRYAWSRSNNGVNVINEAGLPLFPFDSSDPLFRSGKLKTMNE